MKFVSYTVHW